MPVRHLVDPFPSDDIDAYHFTVSGPGQYAFVVKFGGIELSPPFFNPVRVILTYGTNEHRKSQSVTDCKLYYWGIKCREP